MGQFSSIEWTDHTFNPWWGCVKVSPGCVHCYAETWAKRYGNDIWGKQTPRKFFSEAHWREPVKWNLQAQRDGARRRVFCASMADVFEDHPDVEPERTRLWRLIETTPHLDWLLLTKRPENMLRFAPWKGKWPANIWAMTSVENQQQAERRIPLLVQVPAKVRGLSVEPLIGEVSLRPWLKKIHWVIVGGESGHGARAMHPAWALKVKDECQKSRVPFFFKQWGQWAPIRQVVDTQVPPETFMQSVGKGNAGRVLDGRVWNEFPLAQKHSLDSVSATPMLAVGD